MKLRELEIVEAVTCPEEGQEVIELETCRKCGYFQGITRRQSLDLKPVWIAICDWEEG